MFNYRNNKIVQQFTKTRKISGGMKRLGNIILRVIIEWMKSNTLSTQNIRHSFKFMLKGAQITLSKQMKYLGMHLLLDKFQEACRGNSKKVTSALIQLMPNVHGPNYWKRKVLNSVVDSNLLYGSSMWSNAMHIKKKFLDSPTSSSAASVPGV